MRRLDAAARNLRLTATVGLDELSRTAPPADRVALRRLTGADPAMQLLLSDFLAQACQYVSVSGRTGVVGWWNAFDDAWIITQWTIDASGWRLTDVSALLGADLSPAEDSAASPAFDWPMRVRGLEAALAANNRVRVHDFETAVRTGALAQRLGDRARQTRAWAALEDRQALQAHFLATVLVSPDSVTGLRSDARLAGLPWASRQSLRPAMVARRGDGLTVLATSPLSPGTVVVLELQPPQPGAPLQAVSVRTMSLFDGSRS